MSLVLVHTKLLFVAFIWGLGWTAGRVIATDFPPITAAWLRYIVAVSLFFLWLHFSKKFKIPTLGEWKRLFFIGFCSTFLYQLFFMFGMKYTAAGDASLMITFNPILTALLAIPFLGEKMTKRLGIGLILSLIGVLILFIYSPNVDIPSSERIIGNFLIIGAAFAWASSTILKKKAMVSSTSDSDTPLSPLQLTVWSSVIGLFILTPWAGIELLDVGIPNFTNGVIISILFLAVFSTVLSYVWFAEGVKTIGANKATLYVYLIPLFGILSGWILIGEKLGFSLVVAFVLIVGGVAIAQSTHQDFKSK